MCLISSQHLDQKSILESDHNEDITIIGCMADLDEHLKPKILKTVGAFKNSLGTKNKSQKNIINNLKKIMLNDIDLEPPLYKNINNFELQNDINQVVINTLLLSKKAKEASINKIIYNAFNHSANPTCTKIEDKQFSIELQLIKGFDEPISRNPSLISKSSIDTVFSRRNHENSISSYTKRKSSVVTSVIEELNNLKQLQRDDSFLKLPISKQKSNNMFIEANFNTNIFSNNESSKSSLGIYESGKSQSPMDIRNLDLIYTRTLNDEFDTALNEDPRCILFPSINCKNPSAIPQNLYSDRTLSEHHSEDHGNFQDDDDENDTSNNGLSRVQSRYSDFSDDETPHVSNTALKGKVSILKGMVKINNNNVSQSLLLKNLKVKLCGYKLIYDHSLQIEKTKDSEVKFNNFSAATESENGLRISRPFVTKELDLLENSNGSLVVRNQKDLYFEFMIDSTEFPSTLNSRYGKIEYRLEMYSNLVNIGNIILTDQIIIQKTLEPEVCNLIDQNDTIYKLNNPLNISNKRSTDNGQTYILRHKDMEHFGFNLGVMAKEDDYLKKDKLDKYLQQHSKTNFKELAFLREELIEPKIFYDVFLSSKTIVLNEPFQFYFSIKKALNCRNDWFLTECILTLEQYYCFPQTKEVVNKDYKNTKIKNKKYKKIFMHGICQTNPKLSDKKESIYIEDAVIKSDLSFFNEVFELKDIVNKRTADAIIPHYDELNTLKDDVNDEIRSLIRVSHKLKISMSLECDRSRVDGKGVKLKKQFSMNIPVYIITSSMQATMILPEYIE